MDVPPELFGLSERLLLIRHQSSDERHQFADFLRYWLRHIPELVKLDLHVLLEGIGVLRIVDDGYAPTWAWDQCRKNANDPKKRGLLNLMGHWVKHPVEAVQVALSVWCHIGRFDATAFPGSGYLVLTSEAWAALEKESLPHPKLVKLLQLCGGPPILTRDQIYGWKARQKPLLRQATETINPCGEIPLEPSVKWVR